MPWRSMTTEVSMSPLARRGSGTRLGVRAGYAIQVGSKTLEVDGRRSVEHGDGRFGAHESVTA